MGKRSSGVRGEGVRMRTGADVVMDGNGNRNGGVARSWGSLGFFVAAKEAKN